MSTVKEKEHEIETVVKEHLKEWLEDLNIPNSPTLLERIVRLEEGLKGVRESIEHLRNETTQRIEHLRTETKEHIKIHSQGTNRYIALGTAAILAGMANLWVPFWVCF